MMKKIAIVFSEFVFFPGYKPENKENLIVPESARKLISKIEKEGFQIVNISKLDQTELKNLLKKYDLPQTFCYNVHEKEKPDDFNYVINMILEYFNMKKEDVIFIGGEGMKIKDIEIIESYGFTYSHE